MDPAPQTGVAPPSGWPAPDSTAQPAQGWTPEVAAEKPFSEEKPAPETVAVEKPPPGEEEDGARSCPGSLLTRAEPVPFLVKAPPSRALNSDDAGAKIDIKLAPGVPELLAAESFESLGLPDELLRGVHSVGYTRPSKIQAFSLPLIFQNPPKNLVAQAKNGSGKTACFLLGMLSRVDPENPAPQAICMLPSRELAIQTMDRLNELAKYSKVTRLLCVSGVQFERGSSINANIIIGTPGRMKSLTSGRHPFISLAHLKVFVLDEADEMVENFRDDIAHIKRTCGMVRARPQILLFSATYAEKVIRFARAIAEAEKGMAHQAYMEPEKLSLDHVRQFFIDCENPGRRLAILRDIYGTLTLGQTIIFARTRSAANDLCRELREDGHATSLLTGGLEREERDRVMKEFRDGKTKVLVTTNVLSRGIDVLSVSLVINYDLPVTGFRDPREPEIPVQQCVFRVLTPLQDYETYLHRVGRTGRFGRKGASISFVWDAETKQHLGQIEFHFKQRVYKLDVDDLEKMKEEVEKAMVG